MRNTRKPASEQNKCQDVYDTNKNHKDVITPHIMGCLEKEQNIGNQFISFVQNYQQVSNFNNFHASKESSKAIRPFKIEGKADTSS